MAGPTAAGDELAAALGGARRSGAARLRRLSGGASRVTSAFDLEGRPGRPGR